MRLSVDKMSVFSFYIKRSILQCREFCIHSFVMLFEETRAEQALFRFLRKYDFKIRQNL